MIDKCEGFQYVPLVPSPPPSHSFCYWQLSGAGDSNYNWWTNIHARLLTKIYSLTRGPCLQGTLSGLWQRHEDMYPPSQYHMEECLCPKHPISASLSLPSIGHPRPNHTGRNIYNKNNIFRSHLLDYEWFLMITAHWCFSHFTYKGLFENNGTLSILCISNLYFSVSLCWLRHPAQCWRSGLPFPYNCEENVTFPH
jgi:hypothetical protein